jgi:hypothetical protein
LPLQVALLRAVHVLVVLENAQLRHYSDGKGSATLRHPIMDNPMFLDTILIALNMPSVSEAPGHRECLEWLGFGIF